MDRISTLLPRVLKKHGLKHEADAALLTHTARRWMAENFPELSATVSVRSFKNAILLLSCDNPIAQQECYAASHSLLKELREKYPDIEIKNVRIVRS